MLIFIILNNIVAAAQDVAVHVSISDGSEERPTAPGRISVKQIFVLSRIKKHFVENEL